MLREITQIARDAGDLILKNYDCHALFGPPAYSKKADGSFLSHTDILAHEFIVDQLKRLDTSIPIISEEDRDIPEYSERKSWKRFWLVDPLDGSREFLRQSTEFTVNIALVQDNATVMGVIYAPAKGVVYFAENGKGTWRQKFHSLFGAQEPERIYRMSVQTTQPIKVTHSRSDDTPAMVAKLLPSELKVETYYPVSSSMKFCMVAEGSVHVYARNKGYFEWDVAAGDCLVKNAGSSADGGKASPFKFNAKELLHSSPFVLGL